MRRRILLAVTIAAALFGGVAAPALAQNSESAPAAAALMKSKPTTPAGGTVTVKVTNWRAADLVELQVVESGSANWKKVLGALPPRVGGGVFGSCGSGVSFGAASSFARAERSRSRRGARGEPVANAGPTALMKSPST